MIARKIKLKKAEETGITLIALVITIILLIILATISIKLFLDDNGILVTVKRAEMFTRQSIIQERLRLNINEFAGNGRVEDILLSKIEENSENTILELIDNSGEKTLENAVKGSIYNKGENVIIYKLDVNKFKEITGIEIKEQEYNGGKWYTDLDANIYLVYDNEADIPGWAKGNPEDGYFSEDKNLKNIIKVIGVVPRQKTAAEILNEELEEAPESWFTYRINSNIAYITGFSDVYKNLENRPTEIKFPTTHNENGREYQIKGFGVINSVCFTGNKELTAIIIPEGYTTICENAFRDCTNIKTIYIPSTTTRIEKNAFKNCSCDQTVLEIPNQVTYIGDYAFEGWSNLQEIIIPENVTNIGNMVFNGADKVKKLIIPQHLIGNGTLFSGSGILYSSKATIEEINFTGDELKEIQSDMFSSCSSLKKISNLENVTKIGSYAFSDCTSLQEITLSEKITSIDICAFKNCKTLKTITIPNGVTTLSQNIFNGCTCLESITMPDGITSIGNECFKNCTNLVIDKLPDNLTRISDYAFYNCKGINGDILTIPESVTYIGEHTFENIKTVKEIRMNGENLRFSVRAFYGMEALEKIVVNSAIITSGGDRDNSTKAFRSTGVNIKEIELTGNTLPEVYEDMFANFTSLEKVTLPDTYTTIRSSAFYCCKGLKHITISPNCTLIEDNVFNTAGLEEIVIPEGVTQIQAYAFKSCNSLNEITLPASLTTVGTGTFSYCGNIQKVRFMGGQSQYDTLGLKFGNAQIITD